MAFALFILYIALSYVHPGDIVPALAPYRFALWTGAAGVAAAIVPRLVRKESRPESLQLWLLLAFAVTIGVSLAVIDRWAGAPLVVVQHFGPSVAMFVLAACSVTTLGRLRIAAGVVIVLTLLAVVQGAAAYHFGWHARTFLLDRTARSGESVTEEPERPGANADGEVEAASADSELDDEDRPGPPRIRGLSMMNDPNDLAVGMIVTLGLIAGWWKPKRDAGHVALAAAACILVYGIYLTRSRGGAVAFLVLLWRLAAKRVGRVPALALLLVAGIGLAALDYGGRSLSAQLDDSASGRLVAWAEGLDMLKASPLLGTGYGQFQDHFDITAHNSLVLCFAETGLLGCFFWVGLLVVTVIELNALENLGGRRTLDTAIAEWAGALQLSLIGFLAASFFLSRTFVPILYLILGLSTSLAAIARAAGREVRLPALPDLAAVVAACELAGIALVYGLVRLPLT